MKESEFDSIGLNVRLAPDLTKVIIVRYPPSISWETARNAFIGFSNDYSIIRNELIGPKGDCPATLVVDVRNSNIVGVVVGCEKLPVVDATKA